VRPERHEHEELVAVGAQEVDERPGRVRVAAERVQDERQSLLLPDRLEVARNLPKDICANVDLEALAVARHIRENAGLELGTDLPEDRRTRLNGHC
jgi:hypothetical protein